MSLHLVEFYLKEGDEGTYTLVAHTPYDGHYHDLTPSFPSKEEAIRGFQMTLETVGALDVELSDLREKVTLLGTPQAETSGAEVLRVLRDGPTVPDAKGKSTPAGK